MNTTWSRWLKRKKAKQAKATARKPKRVVLTLEALEERAVPSTYTVNDPTGVDGTGSVSGSGGNFTATTLRAAINAANADNTTAASPDTINVPGNVNHYVLTLGALPITDSVIIVGAGASSTIIDAQTNSRVFEITGTTSAVTLQGLTITGGVAPVNTGGSSPPDAPGLNPGDAGGGGILDEANSLTLVDSTVSGNKAQGADAANHNGPFTSGGSGYGGGIYQYGGTLMLTDSMVSTNQAIGGYGGFDNAFLYGGDAVGGGIATSLGALVIQSSTITENQANAGSGGRLAEIATGGNAWGGGVADVESARPAPAPPAAGTVPTPDGITITDSTVSNNQAIGGYGGVDAFLYGGNAHGGGAFTRFGQLHIQSSTINNNTAQGGNLNNGEQTTNVPFGSGGFAYGGGVADEPTVALGQAREIYFAVSNSTFYKNTAQGGVGGGEGSGGDGRGGSIFNHTGAMVTNTTIADSQAYGGGDTNESGSPGFAYGGGFYNAYGGTATAEIGSTIIAADSLTNGDKSSTTGQGQDVYDDNIVRSSSHQITSLDFNLIGDDDQPTNEFTGAHDKVGTPLNPFTAAQLFETNLLDTKDAPDGLPTLALRYDLNVPGGISPAIDQGKDFPPVPPTPNVQGVPTDPNGNLLFDERDPLRTVRVLAAAPPGDGTDIGAFEVQLPTVVTTRGQVNANVGDVISDIATLVGGDNTIGGTVTFNLYSSATTQNASTLLFTDANEPVNGALEASTTKQKYTVMPGDARKTLYWVATYNADPRIVPVLSGAADEPVFIGQLPPPPPPPANTTPGYPGTFFVPPVNPPTVDPDFASKAQLLGSDPLSVQAADNLFVNGLYHQLLSRAPDVGGLNSWVFALESGGLSRLQVIDAIWRSPEHRGLEVANDYLTFLHRAGDPTEIAGWVNVFLAGASEAQVAQDFLLSTEYQAAHADNAAYVAGLYTDVLGRAPDGGAIGWQMALANGESRADVAAAFLASPEVDADLVNLYYTTYLHRSPGAAEAQPWVVALEGGGLSPMQVGELILASPEFFANPH